VPCQVALHRSVDDVEMSPIAVYVIK
jgi:hypothetical protein